MKKNTTLTVFSDTLPFTTAQAAASNTNSRPFVIVLLLLFWFIFSANLLAQNINIKGRVLSEKGEALTGATVQLRNTTQGTVSDVQGFFYLSILEKILEKSNYEIEISFVGYQKIVQKIEIEKYKNEDYLLEIRLKEGVTLGEITINAYREYPVTLTEVSRQELEKRNLGQDIPVLLNFTPSVVTTTDAGAGVGYTGMRIRGSDATRTNVTLNGIPLNDAESQGVFWVNMPDFVSSASHIQIQRGVGTSVNGAGAFGATVNIDTEIPNENPYAELANSVGSFQTRKHTLRLGTGKIGKNFAFNGRLSRIKSDGFIDRAFSDLSSYFVSGLYQNQKGTQIRANVFGGKEMTFQAWNGVPEEILRAGNRTYNELSGYDNEIDNYEQQHYQFIIDQKISPQFFLNTAFHYTKGRGYFEQFREKDELSRYNMPDLAIGDSLITESDLVRRRWLDNDFYGIVFNLNYQSKAVKNHSPNLHLIVGGGWNRYEGKHFGEVIWAEFSPASKIRHRYYDNDATKTDANLYLKANYQILTDLFLFADLQLRQIDYDFLGFDNDLRNVTQNAKLAFFNPKFGLTYDWKKNRFYASFARAHREPNRNDFTESSPESRPQAERLDNVEIGWQRNFGKLSLAANYFLMQYKDQLVLTGRVNDVGAYTRQNVKNSYRTGIEIVSNYDISKQFSWQGNLTWSSNKIRNFIEFLDDYDNGGQVEISYGDTDIAFSPTWVGASQLSYTPIKGFQISWLAKYVSEQYLDNTSSDSRKIEAFLINDLQMSYQFSWGSLKNIELNFMLNNLLNVEYENNGYTFGYLSEGQMVRQNYYYPQAGRNFLLGLRLSF